MRYILLFVAASFGLKVQAAEEEFVASALRPANGIEWHTMAVKVVDAQGASIEGAAVRPWALRAGNGHGHWDGTMGAPRETLSDRRGQTSVVYPKQINWGAREWNPVVSVSMIVSHPEFVTRNVHLDVPADGIAATPEVTLKPGVRLRVAGVEPGTDQPLDHCHLLIENPDAGGREFAREADGWLLSKPISEDRRWFRVVQAAPGKPPRFSRPIAWIPEEPASREQRVELRPGTRVEGKVSDNVVRPITRGHVVAWCGSPIRNEDAEFRRRPIFWMETASIEPDGSFVFESLPSGYLAQFYAFANDSISSQPSDADFELCCKWFSVKNQPKHDSFRNGQILRLAGATSEVTIVMEPAGEVRVKCVDLDGKPLRGVTVSSWPNQHIVGGGSTVFCDRRSSLAGLSNSPEPHNWRKTSPFAVDTDADGIAVIRNLPAGVRDFIADNDVWVSNEADAESVPGSPAELVIKLKRQE